MRIYSSFIFIVTTLCIASATLPASAIDEEVRQEIEAEATKEREAEASEDPLIQRQAEKTDNPVLHAIMPDRFNIYGSLRLRYRKNIDESIVGDGGSRVGIDDQWQFFKEYWLLGRLEIGFNILDNIDLVFDPGGNSQNEFGDDIFLRLGYVGLETPTAFLLFGKNWSTYYQIASFTDRFQGAGGGASGAFNAGTDGGPSGTGRADRVIQSRIQIAHPWGPLSEYKPFNLNIQYQIGEKIPYAGEAHYAYGGGGSAILERRDNIKVGIAVNYAGVHTDDLQTLRKIGIDGDDLAVLIGAQWFGPKWYLATTFSWMDNHMATEDGIYFDAWGSEGYGHYQLMERIWLVAGWNFLEPRSGERQAGDYVLRYAILGLRYTFKDFERMIYANVRFDKSHLYSSTSAEEVGDIYTVGIKWNFDW